MDYPILDSLSLRGTADSTADDHGSFYDSELIGAVASLGGPVLEYGWTGSYLLDSTQDPVECYHAQNLVTSSHFSHQYSSS